MPASHGPSWPRHFLLQVYALAVKNGKVLLHPMPEEHVASFKASFLRLRRRSDKTHDQYITDAYHLVSIGKWTPARGGTLPILYDDYNGSMPNISDANGNPLQATPITADERTTDDEPDIDPDNFIADLIRESTKPSE